MLASPFFIESVALQCPLQGAPAVSLVMAVAVAVAVTVTVTAEMMTMVSEAEADERHSVTVMIAPVMAVPTMMTMTAVSG